MKNVYDSGYSQKDLLRERYIENSSFFDRIALFFGKLGIILKTCVYLGLIAGLVLSSVFFNPILIGVLVTALFFVGSIHMQNHSLINRFDLMVEDLCVSEKQLQQAFSLNQSLEQLKQAYQNNYTICDQLEQCKIKISLMAENSKEKKMEIDVAHKQISEYAKRAEFLSERVHVLERELKTTIHAVLDKFNTGPVPETGLADNPLDANRPGFFKKN